LVSSIFFIATNLSTHKEKARKTKLKTKRLNAKIENHNLKSALLYCSQLISNQPHGIKDNNIKLIIK